MKFITWSKISLVGLPAAVRVLFKHDCRLGSNGSHCRCLPVVSTCTIFIKLPHHIITEVQMRDFFEMAINNEIGFGIVEILEIGYVKNILLSSSCSKRVPSVWTLIAFIESIVSFNYSTHIPHLIPYFNCWLWLDGCPFS